MQRSAIMQAAVLAVAVVLVVCSCSEHRTENGASTTTTPPVTVGGPCAGDDLIACARASTLKAYVPARATKATGTPIKLGMINQENTPAGSFPELSQADQAAIAFVNDELGGIEGHPIQLEVCNTKFSAEGSTTCGQRFVQEKVPAVLGGIDVFGNGIDVLNDNKIPFVGGIPISDASVKDANSFQWSGGSWGASVAFAQYAATTLKAKSAAIVYGEFGPITDAADYGKKVLQALGVSKVQMVPYPITATDLSTAVAAAGSGQPDVIFMLTADSGCKGGFDAIHTLGIKATVFYTGACTIPAIIAEAGPAKTNGTIFNVEVEIKRDHPAVDTTLYTKVIQKYGKGLDPIGAGTVSFRAFMNLYMVLADLGADGITPAAITDALGKKVDAPSFTGHTYTCDHRQFAGLPAMCSPQQILAEMQDGNLHQLGTWIDVGQIYGG